MQRHFAPGIPIEPIDSRVPACVSPSLQAPARVTCNLSMTCPPVVFIHNSLLRLAQNLDAEQEDTRDFCQR